MRGEEKGQLEVEVEVDASNDLVVDEDVVLVPVMGWPRHPPLLCMYSTMSSFSTDPSVGACLSMRPIKFVSSDEISCIAKLFPDTELGRQWADTQSGSKCSSCYV